MATGKEQHRWAGRVDPGDLDLAQCGGDDLYPGHGAHPVLARLWAGCSADAEVPSSAHGPHLPWAVAMSRPSRAGKPIASSRAEPASSQRWPLVRPAPRGPSRKAWRMGEYGCHVSKRLSNIPAAYTT